MSEAVAQSTEAEAEAIPQRRTALFERHVAAGGKLVPFAGWEMPVQYADGIRAEHAIVRSAAGVFDVSHMGEIETTGPQATEFLQHLLSNDVAKLAVGGAQYSTLCQQDGGVIDDLFTYRLGDSRYLTVTNASNHQTDFEWFVLQAADFNVEISDRANSYAMIALQGPTARSILDQVIDEPAPVRMTAKEMTVAGVPALVCGTGYTGEDGVEILVAPEHAVGVWDALVELGAQPIGLAARDTLRLEVCFHLYGNDLALERNPIEAGLGWCCALDTGFVGSEALAAVKAAGPKQKLVSFVFDDKGIPRQGNPVLVGGQKVGQVTSGTLSPSLDIGIGMAYINTEHSEVGTAIEVDVRGKLRSARIAAKPLYKKA